MRKLLLVLALVGAANGKIYQDSGWQYEAPVFLKTYSATDTRIRLHVFTKDTLKHGKQLNMLRYADSTGNTVLPFWAIDTAAATTACSVWVTVPAGYPTNSKILMYGSKIGASYAGNIRQVGHAASMYAYAPTGDAWFDFRYSQAHDIAVDSVSGKYSSEPWNMKLDEKDDTGYVIYYTADTNVHGGTAKYPPRIVYKRTADNFVTYGAEDTIKFGPDSTSYIPGSIATGRFRNKKTVFMVYRLYKNQTGSDERQYFTYSQDSLRTWSDSIKIGPDTVTTASHGRMHIRPSGRIFVATYSVGTTPWSVYICYADTPYTSWNYLTLQIAGKNINETTLYLSKNDTLVAISRNETSPYEYYKTRILNIDGVPTLGVSDSVLGITHADPNPPDISYAPNGLLWWLYSDNAVGNVKAYISTDSGLTWQRAVSYFGQKGYVITSGLSGQRPYPNAYWFSNGKGVCAWTTNRRTATVTSYVYQNFFDAYGASLNMVSSAPPTRRPVTYDNNRVLLREQAGSIKRFIAGTRLQNGSINGVIFETRGDIRKNINTMGLQDTTSEADYQVNAIKLSGLSTNNRAAIYTANDSKLKSMAAGVFNNQMVNWKIVWKSDFVGWYKNDSLVYQKLPDSGSGIPNFSALYNIYPYNTGDSLYLHSILSRPYTATLPTDSIGTWQQLVSGPTITASPQSATDTIGSTATFSVSATGTGTLSYQWRRKLASGAWANVGTNASTYTTGTLTRADTASKYAVLVTDDNGTSPSDTAVLTVALFPPVISYGDTLAICSTGISYTFPMSNTGFAVDSVIFSGLVDGVTGSRSTGTITVLRDSIYDTLIVTAIAYNSSGQDTALCSLQIVQGRPAISYGSNPAKYRPNVAIATNTVTNAAGGTVDSFLVSPALPAGLSISKTTGAITGTPTVKQPATSYTVTAYNSVGTGTVALSISIGVETQAGPFRSGVYRGKAFRLSYRKP